MQHAGKISGGTRSDQGRDCRDAFLGLLLTCAKLGVSFWDFLGHRLGVAEADAPYLPDLIRLRSATPERPDFCPKYCENPLSGLRIFCSGCSLVVRCEINQRRHCIKLLRGAVPAQLLRIFSPLISCILYDIKMH